MLQRFKTTREDKLSLDHFESRVRHGVIEWTAFHNNPINEHSDTAYSLSSGVSLCHACRSKRHPKKDGYHCPPVKVNAEASLTTRGLSLFQVCAAKKEGGRKYSTKWRPKTRTSKSKKPA